jgi:selenocysteine lyase/cysteine desulfurase
VKLKEAMGVEQIQKREEELLAIVFDRFSKIENIELLEGNNKKRLGVISFIVKGAHYNLIVKILNDRFGIQTRGGCACAGTYGHLLLHVNEIESYELLDMIHTGDLSCKPGWIRLSIHPTMTNAEMQEIMDAIEDTAAHFRQYQQDYDYDTLTNEYHFRDAIKFEQATVKKWFSGF